MDVIRRLCFVSATPQSPRFVDCSDSALQDLAPPSLLLKVSSNGSLFNNSALCGGGGRILVGADRCSPRGRETSVGDYCTHPVPDHCLPAVHALRQHGVLLPEIDSCLELWRQLPSEPVFQASRFRGRRGPDPILFVGVSFIFPSASELMARFRVCWVRSRPQRGHRWAPGYRFEQNVSVPPSLFRCRQ